MRVCLVQLNSQDQKDVNLSNVSRLLEEAIAATSPDLISLPELFTYLGGTAEGARASAESVPDGPACQILRDTAMRHGVYVHGGSINELDGNALFNTTVVFDPQGALIARYRKLHMFDIVTPDGKVYAESATYSRGQDIVTVDIAGIRFGCTICYDLRFSELYAALVDAGAQALFVPAAFTMVTGKDHWEVLCRARAIETQCYVLAANQIGPYIEDGVPRASYGNSMIVDPWGTVIARCPDRVGFCATTIELDYQNKVRSDLPCLRHKVVGQMLR